MDKLISVIIPTHNRNELTDKAVLSVVTTFPYAVEILVIDDCGSSPYAFNHINASGVSVKVIRLDKNIGAGMARHAGVELSLGRYIAFLDSDDRYDAGWIDYLFNLLGPDSADFKSPVFISGITQGGKKFGAIVRDLLINLPDSFQLIVVRIISVLFNPFYTPSIVMSKELCVFMRRLRHCEDYYSTAFALFGANKIILPQVIACHLGRIPNTHGGESAAKKNMFCGEMKVRLAFISSKVPLYLKLMVPFGMVYQIARTIIKILL